MGALENFIFQKAISSRAIVVPGTGEDTVENDTDSNSERYDDVWIASNFRSR